MSGKVVKVKSILQRYDRLVKKEKLRPDKAQRQAAMALNGLCEWGRDPSSPPKVAKWFIPQYEGHALHESKEEAKRKRRAQQEMDDIANYTRQMANQNKVLTGAAAWKAVLQNQSQKAESSSPPTSIFSRALHHEGTDSDRDQSSDRETEIQNQDAESSTEASHEAENSGENSSALAGEASKTDQASKPDAIKSLARGVYLVGSVGRGKTYLMDVFFKHCATSSKVPVRWEGAARRVHFNSFLLQIHKELHAFLKDKETHQAGKSESDGSVSEEEKSNPGLSPIDVVGNRLADEISLLCLDELQLADAQDAIILARILTILLSRGVAVVITSNTRPTQLYSGGLNRHILLPPLLHAMRDLRLVDLDRVEGRPTDFRKVDPADEFEARKNGFFFHGHAGIQEYFSQHCSGGTMYDDVKIGTNVGRELVVPKSCKGGKFKKDIAFFTFNKLCGQSGKMGDVDILALIEKFPVLCVSNVPRLRLADYDEAIRFIRLIDIAYDSKSAISLSTECENVSEIFEEFVESTADTEENADLEWRTTLFSSDGQQGMAPAAVGALRAAGASAQRAISRLTEMQKWEHVLAKKASPKAQSEPQSP